MKAVIDIDGLEAFIDERVRAALAALDAGKDDPWLGSKGAAAYMDVGVQRIHDLVCAELLPRYGEKGERLYFRRSDLDHYMRTRGRS